MSYQCTKHRMGETDFEDNDQLACPDCDNERLNNRITELEHKVDELMLEYCPDDMTTEQLERWGRHQVPQLEQNDE